MTEITIQIPDRFYAGGKPQIFDYMDGKCGFLLFRETGMHATDLAEAFGGDPADQWTVVSLLSPYVLGWDNYDAGIKATTCNLVGADLEARTVTVRLHGGRDDQRIAR